MEILYNFFFDKSNAKCAAMLAGTNLVLTEGKCCIVCVKNHCFAHSVTDATDAGGFKIEIMLCFNFGSTRT